MAKATTPKTKKIKAKKPAPSRAEQPGQCNAGNAPVSGLDLALKSSPAYDSHEKIVQGGNLVGGSGGLAPLAADSAPETKPDLRNLTVQERQFLRAYFKNGGNATAACRVAYPDVKDADSWGPRVAGKLRPYIAAWLDDEGLSERYLKEKLLEGLDATEVKVFNAGGALVKEKDGETTYVPGEIIYSEPMIAWGPRQGFLKLAMTSKGMLVDKSEVNLKGQVGVTLRADLPPDLLTALGSISTELLKTRFKA